MDEKQMYITLKKTGHVKRMRRFHTVHRTAACDRDYFRWLRSDLAAGVSLQRSPADPSLPPSLPAHFCCLAAFWFWPPGFSSRSNPRHARHNAHAGALGYFSKPHPSRCRMTAKTRRHKITTKKQFSTVQGEGEIIVVCQNKSTKAEK